MALIKCSECGEEISDTLNNCSICGYPLKNNNNNNNNNKGIGITFIIIGIVSIIWGLGLTYSGISSSSQTYGGDAYTGIQNASSRTANNINELGETLCMGLKGILVVMGGAIMFHGVYIMTKKDGC